MKTLTGTVISNRMEKTAVVSIESRWQHPVYKKTVKRTKKYLVHDEKGVGIGDLVTISPSRPFSKTKSWIIVEVNQKATIPTKEQQ